MAVSRMDGVYETKPLPIIGKYNVQRFKQFSPEDSANFYIVPGENTKRPFAMYPTMGRKHIAFGGINRLIFPIEPRVIFRTINYWYAVVGSNVYRMDHEYNQVEISGGLLKSFAGIVYYDYLVVNQLTFVMLSDNEAIYVYEEVSGTFSIVTDHNAPGNYSVNGIQTKPGCVVAFGNRFAVSVFNSSQFVLSVINLLTGAAFDPATCFTVDSAQVFAQEKGIIRAFGVLNNTLYIFTDFTTGVWANIPAFFSGTGATFPWKKNTTYDWNFGIADSSSLDIDFGIMVFLAQNKDGLLQVMMSQGGNAIPEKISDKAIDVLLQRYTNAFGNTNPFLQISSSGFLYQYENAIFYRLSAGDYTGNGILDQEQTANSIEFSFDAKEWHRCIELNGERNRIQQHVFYNNTHLVTVNKENTVYEMSDFYVNEIANAAQSDRQAVDAYIQYPFRYERVTPIISEQDYSEFQTEYVEIDFVFGDSNINFSEAPFQNTVFIIDEQSTSTNITYMIDENPDADNQPIFIIDDQGNTPSLNDLTYNALYKPSIELFFSDDGGISFNSADVREFSQQGQYQWRMRWYQLGMSRNRVYKLIAVSPVPIVILGAVMNVRRASGGTN